MSDNEKKLKTLKDIEQVDILGGYLVKPDELRESAREWINLFQKDLAKPDIPEYNGLFGWYSSQHNIEGAICWIKHFFNLDLEDE